MDKYEFKIKLDQMKTLVAERNYTAAAEIADSINWRKVKNINTLMKAGDVYTKAGNYDEARDILLMAYDRSPIGRMIIYRLAELAIKMKSFDEAEEYYEEFVEIAPNDNLKYVLRYKLSKAKGANIRTLITILEELKEVEYNEEWFYELAYLYHQAGEHEKCIEACDELFLWFGDGIYVERALELKMLYRPLSQFQEDRYKSFKGHRDGVKEVHPQVEDAEETVSIPVVRENVEKFNTVNLQEELAKSMQQIMDATEKETVEETMDNIKKMVEEVPFYQMPSEERVAEIQQEKIEADREINESLKNDFREFLSEDYDGQLSLFVQGQAVEPQIQGQMNMEDVLGEWRKTQRAIEAAMQMAEQKKLESAKAMALREAGDIMEWLVDMNPSLSEEFPEAEIFTGAEMGNADEYSVEEAGQIVAGVNDVLQQQINKLQEEKEPELLRRIKMAKPNFDEQIGLKPYVPEQFEEPEELLEEEVEQEELPQIPDMEEEILREMVAEPEIYAQEPVQDTIPLPEIALPEDIETIEKQDTKEIVPKAIEDALEKMEKEEVHTENPKSSAVKMLTKLTDEQREHLSYFAAIDGMEDQICRAVSEAVARLQNHAKATNGNILIEGDSGCGKTKLATSLVKIIQKELNRQGGKVGKIDAAVLNKKDVAELLKKIKGGCLIIENAGSLNLETVISLSLLLEQEECDVLIILEGTKAGLKQALGINENFAKKFSAKIRIPMFTIDELVNFGKTYANDLNYEIDAMGVLALYNRIGNIQRLDAATTLAEVKDIVDEAIANAEKKSIKKAFSILTSKRYSENDYVILREKDFEE